MFAEGPPDRLRRCPKLWNDNRDAVDPDRGRERERERCVDDEE
jgi:hypothetical protein